MAITLDATIGGDHSNSYCDVSFADSYFEDHENQLVADAWYALSDEKKARLLIKACRIIDGFRFTLSYNPDRPRFSWVPISYPNSYGDGPYKNDPYQKLQFPRNIDFDSSGELFVPEEILMAQCEEAYYLLVVDTSALENRIQGIAMDRVSIGPLQATQEYNSTGYMLSPMVYELIKDHLIRSTRIGRA